MAEVEDSAAQALVNKVVALTAELVQTKQQLNLVNERLKRLTEDPAIEPEKPATHKKQTSEK